MDKIITYEMAKALRDHRPLCLLAEIDHPTEIYRAWTGVGTLNYKGVVSTSPYSVAFDRYPLDYTPVDWLKCWSQENASTYTVIEDSTSLYGRALRLTRGTVGTSRDGLQYLGLNNREITDGEILTRIRPQNEVAEYFPGVVCRGSGVGNFANGVFPRLIRPGGVKQVELVQSLNGVVTNQFAAVNYEWTTTKYTWIRFRFQDNNFKVRLWAEDEEEPSTWQIDFTTAGNALQAQYFNNITLTPPVAYSALENPFYTFPSDASPRTGVNATNYSINWRGRLIAPISGKLTLGLGIDDGGRLYVDGVLIIDSWINQSETLYTAEIDVVQGQELDISFEYYQAAGGAAAKLYWGYSGNALAQIPNTSLIQYSLKSGWVGFTQVNSGGTADVDFFSIAIGTDSARKPLDTSWKGIGVLGNIAPVQAVNDISIQEVMFTLSGVSLKVLDMLMQPVRNRIARAWLAALNKDGSIVRDPLELCNCEMDTIGYKIDEKGTATVTIVARSGFYSLDRASNDVWSNEDQQRRFPGDTGMKYLSTLQNQDVIWTP